MMATTGADHAILRADRVRKTYGSGPNAVTAVRDVSLTVEAGEIVLIMGPSGSGKTTLLSMLGAMLRPSSGSIRLGDITLTDLPERQLPELRLKRLGFVFQDFNLLSALTALDNVALVAELAGTRSRDARVRARELLTAFGLGARLDFLPEDLSGGERQRVAIARALANEPDLIIADEPTANLDARHGQELLRLLRQVAKERNRSVVIAAHDERIRAVADRVLWLEDGRFKEIGTMTSDPVCGMLVDRSSAISTEWEGRRYSFCARGCRDEFLSDPERFVTGADRT